MRKVNWRGGGGVLSLHVFVTIWHFLKVSNLGNKRTIIIDIVSQNKVHLIS